MKYFQNRVITELNLCQVFFKQRSIKNINPGTCNHSDFVIFYEFDHRVTKKIIFLIAKNVILDG